MNKKDWFPNVTIRKQTPVGVLFVSIMEDSETGKAVQLIINSGKAGSEFAAFTDSISRLANVILNKDPDGLNTVMSELSNITTDRSARNTDGLFARSAAEGIYFALLDYKNEKMKEFESTYDHNYRPATIQYKLK